MTVDGYNKLKMIENYICFLRFKGEFVQKLRRVKI